MWIWKLKEGDLGDPGLIQYGNNLIMERRMMME